MRNHFRSTLWEPNSAHNLCGTTTLFGSGIGFGSLVHQRGAYGQAMDVLHQMQKALAKAGSDFGHVVRTWFCLGDITETEAGIQRYMELNRARSDFYDEVRFSCSLPVPTIPHGIYPASTGIGMTGTGLVASCL